MFELTIQTERLRLRPFRPADATRIQRLAGEREIAIMTSSIPHPYPDGAAESWIEKQDQRRAEGKGYAFAIELEGAAAGCVGLDADKGTHLELGYWLGTPYWGRGIVSEAAAAAVEFAFGWLNKPALEAGYFTDNPASGRILEKLGFVRTHVRKTLHHLRQGEADLVRLILTQDAWAAKRV